jgi:Uncharacterised nucleotidyltransferase
MSDLSPEDRILLYCSAAGVEASQEKKVPEALNQVAAWQYLRQAAWHHGIFPSLYCCLSHVAPDVLPPAFLQEIQDLYRAHAQRNLKITRELLRLLALLENHGLAALPFKGPVLAQVAYGDVTLRQFVDLDLLVRRADMPRIKKLLLSLGYRLDHAYTAKQEEVHLHHANEFSFSHPDKTRLDVHWRFVPLCLGGGPDVDLAFARRVPLNLMGKTVYTLSPTDHLLVLCLNGAFDPYALLSQISDVAHFIRSQPTLDWETILHEAETVGLRRVVLLRLSLAQEILEAPVPSHIRALAAEDQAVARLRRQMWQSLFSYPEKEPDLFLSGLRQWQTRERFGDKLHYVWKRTFLPTVQDWHWVSLPDSRYWLYYLLRPWRLFVQGVLMPLKHRWC